MSRSPGRTAVAAVSAALVLGTAACIPADSDAQPEYVPETTDAGPETTDAGPEIPDEPVVAEGEAFVVEPLEEIDGAETWRTDGIVLQVPRGAETERTLAGDGVVGLAVFDPDVDEDGVLVHVSTGKDLTEEAVDLAVRGAGAAARTGGVDLVRTEAEWSAWSYTTAALGYMEVDGALAEGGVVSAMSPDATRLVSVTVRVPVGTLKDSWQYEVLRTIRPAP